MTLRKLELTASMAFVVYIILRTDDEYSKTTRRKNLKTSHEYESTKKVVLTLSTKIKEAEKRICAFNDTYPNLKKNYVYRVISPESTSTKIEKDKLLVKKIVRNLRNQIFSSARSKSAIKSATSSMPTFTRTKSSVAPAFFFS